MQLLYDCHTDTIALMIDEYSTIALECVTQRVFTASHTLTHQEGGALL